MLEVNILYLHFPMERTCPLARKDQYKIHDKFVKVNLRSGRLCYMQEYMYRLYEYFYYQVIGALSDSNPYSRTRAKANDLFKELLRQAKESAHGDFGEKQYSEDPECLHPHWTILNAPIFSELQQSPYCTGLDVRISHPLMILKDRLYNKRGKIRAEASEIVISATTAKKAGRYKSQPERLVQTDTKIIRVKGMSLQYTNGIDMTQEVFTILAPTNFLVERESVTWSPILDKRQFLTPGFDFCEFDYSQHYRFKFEPIRMKTVQEIYTYFLKCIDLNVNYSDGGAKKFQLAIWDDPDSQKYLRLEEEMRRRFKDHPIIHRQKMDIEIPSLSMLLLTSDDNVDLE